MTDEWQDRGVTQGKEYAILTNEITRQALEAETGKLVITSKNAVDFARLIDEVVKEVEQPKEGNTDKKEIQ